MLEAAQTKLVTREDRFHVHKLCGLYVLLHFAYRLALYGGGAVPAAAPPPAWSMVPHALLPMTSFMFRVLPARPIGRRSSMFIWRELRLHALLFSLRSVAVLWWPWAAQRCVVATMAAADLATRWCGEARVTTVRGDHDNMRRRSAAKLAAGAFFSSSQLGATLLCSGLLQGGAPSPLLVFFTLPAIQTSAFGMTLIRKNVISPVAWGAGYSAQLLLVYVLWACEYGNLRLLWASAALYLFRRACGTHAASKYLMWGAIAALDSYFPGALK